MRREDTRWRRYIWTLCLWDVYGGRRKEKTLAMLVARERSGGMTMATVAPRKSSGEWLGKRVMAFMREAGCEVEAVVIKTDNEPALVKVVEEIGRLRAAKGGRGMVVENSPVHSSKSNGYIERSVQGGPRDDTDVAKQSGR